MKIEEAFQIAISEISPSLPPYEHGLNLNCQEVVLLEFHLLHPEAQDFLQDLCSLSDVIDDGDPSVTSKMRDRYAKIIERMVVILKDDSLFRESSGSRDFSAMLNSLSHYLYDVVHGVRKIGPLAEAYFVAVKEVDRRVIVPC